MEPNVAEALKAKFCAEKHFAEGDFTGARNYALKAQMICPQLDGISQMVATFGVYTASEVRINGELDHYGIIGVEPSAVRSIIKRQYKKMAALLHPDKNKCTGADGAFKYVSDAWTVLSDRAKRGKYDRRRNVSVLHAPGSGGSYIDYSNAQVSSHRRLDTFWTVCTSCHVQYEYLLKYVNKRLSCKNCRGVFIAVETGAAPANGSFQYTYEQEKGYGRHGCAATYMSNNIPVYHATNDVSGYHQGNGRGHGSEYPSNVSIQFNSFPGTPASGVDANGFSTSTYITHQPNGKTSRAKANGKDSMKRPAANVVPNGHYGSSDNSISKPDWSAKKRKVDEGSGNEEVPARNNTETRLANAYGNVKTNSKLYQSTETSVRRQSTAPTFDVRQLLIDKARSDICKKVEEMRLASEAEKKRKALAEAVMSGEAGKTSQSNCTTELKRSVSMSITVPDSDFHDFDKDRSEECFKNKQIWALYDEEDGMPRLYCLIRQVISVKPFKIFISYLSSKTDSEFGSVNWLSSGFTKSCGSFRVFNSETVEQVNIFSHLLSKEKAGRGGLVRIYPRSGDIWAVYRNWSPDWNRQTPDDIRHQYEMVEVLDNYSEEVGVCVTPLVRVNGYKTVYQRNNNESIRWVPRREMLRFSHQVPACLLKGDAFNVPDDCWDLDPAAIPDELLQRANDLLNDSIPNRVGEIPVISNELYPSESSKTEDAQANNYATTPQDKAPQDEKHVQAATGVQVLDRWQEENQSISQFELP